MRKSLIAVALLLVASGSAYAGKMLDGAIYRLSDGHKLEFAIEKSRGTGKMTAFDSATGETFEGQYAGAYTSGIDSKPTSADAGGILLGDKGTVIEINLTIKPGFRPTGFGTGKDNNDRLYRVIF